MLGGEPTEVVQPAITSGGVSPVDDPHVLCVLDIRDDRDGTTYEDGRDENHVGHGHGVAQVALKEPVGARDEDGCVQT